ncbi:MAG: agmatine deiminase family protein [Pseudomonadales bacterium]|nr:agmatine deiminase family protein [Pseudomonadales bacterium]
MNQAPQYRFLAEWHHQEAVMIAWPHESTDWAPWLQDIESTYIELTQAICGNAKVLILCKSEEHQAHIGQLLPAVVLRQVIFFPCNYNDTWCRDFGPISLGANSLASMKSFQFTGWGNKYDANEDNQVNSKLAQAGALQCPLEEIAFDLEGGGIETDGEGTLLTTVACLMAGNRNIELSQSEVEEKLKSYLGVSRVIWFQHGALLGDDTDSHIDNLVRFADTETLIYASCRNPKDPHFETLKAMESEVLNLKTVSGKPYQCIDLEIPEAILDETGSRLPASYVNFLIVNESVIVPTFDSPMDSIALDKLTNAFPNKAIIDLNGRHLIKQFGGPHCATMQLPSESLNKNFLLNGVNP